MRSAAVSQPSIAANPKAVPLPPPGTKCAICGRALRKFWCVLPSGLYADARCFGGGR